MAERAEDRAQSGGVLSRLLETVKENAKQEVTGAVDALANFRAGDGHAGGMFRKGAVELGQYLPAFNNAGAHTVEDQGVWPNQTQGEIAGGRGDTGLDAEEERSSVLGYPIQPPPDQGQDRQQSRGR